MNRIASFFALAALTLAGVAHADKAVISGDGWTVTVDCDDVDISPWPISCSQVCDAINDEDNGLSCHMEDGRIVVRGHGDPTVLPWVAQDGPPTDVHLPVDQPVQVTGEGDGEGTLWLTTTTPVQAFIDHPDGAVEVLDGPIDVALPAGATATVTATTPDATLSIQAW